MGLKLKILKRDIRDKEIKSLKRRLNNLKKSRTKDFSEIKSLAQNQVTRARKNSARDHAEFVREFKALTLKTKPLAKRLRRSAKKVEILSARIEKMRERLHAKKPKVVATIVRLVVEKPSLRVKTPRGTLVGFSTTSELHFKEVGGKPYWSTTENATANEILRTFFKRKGFMPKTTPAIEYVMKRLDVKNREDLAIQVQLLFGSKPRAARVPDTEQAPAVV